MKGPQRIVFCFCSRVQPLTICKLENSAKISAKDLGDDMHMGREPVPWFADGPVFVYGEERYSMYRLATEYRKKISIRRRFCVSC